ncbi:hypothetical protein [Devosia rhizoryzae]|uniref:Uncharacterized protein n=1 Tax=Devosia rhizoryzae TaxID=2774137 RepID=A0ABX7C8Q5_9HYPH|nr:hypothetical protein [Devosia rhizoryzae]QQR40654.1 hypothetical protein JI748_06555 [Devosia rhizoryzae]
MRIARIKDSLDWSEGELDHKAPRVVQQAEVEQEARRRKQGLAIDEWQLREFVSGVPLPERLVQLCRQIDLASAALSRMSPIPANFADDVYWPRMW